jgi:glycosyltransferase involved in cell wall biosynthesis
MPECALRFAMITTFYPPHSFGGDAVSVRSLAHILARRGHRVDVIHDVDAFEALGGRAGPEPEEPEGVRVHRLRSRIGPLSCLATQQLGRPLVHGRRIQQILRDGAFDVIHYHNVSLVGGPGVLRLGDAIKLYTAHEHWLVCPTHILWRHLREPCDRRECLRCQLRHHRPPQLWRRTGKLGRDGRHVDAFLSPSRFSADKHAAFGFPFEMQVLPHFLAPVGPVPPAPSLEAPDAPPFFLFVGRLEKIKGLQDVIPLFAGDAPAELWIAGSGDYEATLRGLAGGSAKVRFLGSLGPEALRAHYARALAVVAPSVCYEVFPMIALEAFREGTPVVARRRGPYPEIIGQSGGGLLFDDQDELRAALDRLAGDPALRAELSRRALRSFEEYWSEERGLRSYYDVIRRVASRRGIRRVLDALGGETEAS